MARRKYARKVKKKVVRRKESIPKILVKGMPPPKAYANFVYSGTCGINMATFDASYGQIQCNSLFDPEITTQWRSNITGERNAQPRYRDQIMEVLYNKYNVLSSNLELRFMNTSAAADDLCRVYVYCIDSGDGSSDSRPTDPGLIEEHPWVKKNGEVKDLGLIRGARAKQTVKCKWNLKNHSLDDKLNNLTAAGTAPSTFVPYYQFGIVTESATVGTDTVYMTYTLSLNVELSEPRYQNVS